MRVASLPVSSILQNYYNKKQFNTITSLLHFGFRFFEFRHEITYLQNLSNRFLNISVDSACSTTLLGRLFHILTTLLVKKKNLRKLYLVRFF